jgi:di/tricarboxylate transporter
VALSARLRLAAIGLLLSSAAGLALLHSVRADLSPASHRLSEYANGSYGVIMTVSFFTLGAGMVVLGLAMRLAGTTHGRSRMVRLAVMAAGCGMVVSGLYPTDPAGAPTTTERVHSLASGSATLALIGAAAVSSLRLFPRRPRRAIGPAGVLACAAVGLGALSPVLHETDWTGLSQRLLWLTLMGWLLVTAWQLAPQPSADAALAAESGSLQDGTSERSGAR